MLGTLEVAAAVDDNGTVTLVNAAEPDRLLMRFEYALRYPANGVSAPNRRADSVPPHRLLTQIRRLDVGPRHPQRPEAVDGQQQ